MRIASTVTLLCMHLKKMKMKKKRSQVGHTVGPSQSMCMWSPWRWEGCEHCVPVNLCKWSFLLMAGLWLCTNGCRCVDGGRTSPVTVLISGCGHGGQLHDSAPTGGHDAFADNSTSGGEKGMAGRGEEENPHALNMNLMRLAPAPRLSRMFQPGTEIGFQSFGNLNNENEGQIICIQL